MAGGEQVGRTVKIDRYERRRPSRKEGGAD
jgi:hypothetical protein